MRRRAAARREQLEALLAGRQASLERARARSLTVDTAFGVLRRERPVAVGILAGSLAFRLFALLIPMIYLLVAGLGFAAGTRPETSSGLGRGGSLGDLVVASVAIAAASSNRGRWLALLFGGAATLVAAAAVVEVLRWVHALAWRVTPSRSRRSAWLVLGLIAGISIVYATSAIAGQTRADAKGLASELTVTVATAAVQVAVLAVLWLALSWALPRPDVPLTALVPGALLFAAGFQACNLAVTFYFVPRAARASTLYGSLGVALTLLVSLFLFARLAVAAAELNATLWERRR